MDLATAVLEVLVESGTNGMMPLDRLHHKIIWDKGITCMYEVTALRRWLAREGFTMRTYGPTNAEIVVELK